ncbi:MAG: LuxR C-terminal-related transcriptional regulator [Proteobacteria bacterium]|jgi:DNA-binding CsgD family transcriptional regulator|nr:LuxR C-terminal-related transcriptional regulator [Pseudomonadota bacterium]
MVAKTNKTNNGLQTYIDALNLLHANSECWIFNSNWDEISVNELNRSFNDLKFYYAPEDKMLPWSKVIQLLKTENKLDVLSNKTDLVGFCNKANKGKNVEPILFSINRISNEKGDIVGFFILSHGNVNNFEYTSLLKYALFDNHNINKVTQNITKRESEILFYLIRGFGYNEIATKLSNLSGKTVSHKTIGNMVRDSLYTKFNVFNRSGLRKLILKTNLCAQLPSSIYNCYA